MAPSPPQPGQAGPSAPSNAPPARMTPASASYAQAASSSTAPPEDNSQVPPPSKKKKHRGGKKRRNRRQSFAASQDLGGDMNDERPSLADVSGHGRSRGSTSFYRLHGNSSNTSLESEALLDHRDQPTIRTRRPSVPMNSMFQSRPSQPSISSPSRLNPPSTSNPLKGSQLANTPEVTYSEEEDEDVDERTQLLGASQRDIKTGTSYGGASAHSGSGRRRATSRASQNSAKRLNDLVTQHHHSQTNLLDYDVNNPPSRPTSPLFQASSTSFDDVMITEDLDHMSDPGRPTSRSRDALIDIDGDCKDDSPPTPGDFRRRMTTTALEDVCFPHETMSELGQDDYLNKGASGEPTSRRRRRRWPDLDVLEGWAQEEKRTIDGMRTRKVNEPLMVEGRLRPKRRVWHREASDAPFRFTYFNETFENTIHSQTISELLQPGQDFRNLFVPDPPLLEDSSDDDTEDEMDLQRLSTNGYSTRTTTRSPSKAEARLSSGEQTRSTTPRPSGTPAPDQQEKPKRYGPRPAWWLDVMSPTETEMKVISKTFGIHPLTSEDILMQEQREKVELFKHYYFINYRTFEQDENSEDYLDPVNLYVVVFREGVISFHFSLTPHPANVRRRIRQLSDYLVLSPDWISYAIIDDITDAYAPMIQRIEEEVDDIDEVILRLHSVEEDQQENEKIELYPTEKKTENKERPVESGRNMLRRVGECRKKVMSLYRLLGNKADVIKGFAKRCNEQWDIAPRNEIGMYLGDIQDHIVTMTGNLSHYENLLSRAHSNYLAQINIRMGERQEKTSDILGKLTVLGTIVLPMNVVTGIWGMNCLVPGQDIPTLTWFWCITGGLIAFGLSCYFIAKRVYGIV